MQALVLLPERAEQRALKARHIIRLPQVRAVLRWQAVQAVPAVTPASIPEVRSRLSVPSTGISVLLILPQAAQAVLSLAAIKAVVVVAVLAVALDLLTNTVFVDRFRLPQV